VISDVKETKDYPGSGSGCGDVGIGWWGRCHGSG
jgi:hypothetical protein